jgi:hypothetical protein
VEKERQADRNMQGIPFGIGKPEIRQHLCPPRNAAEFSIGPAIEQYRTGRAGTDQPTVRDVDQVRMLARDLGVAQLAIFRGRRADKPS